MHLSSGALAMAAALSFALPAAARAQAVFDPTLDTTPPAADVPALPLTGGSVVPDGDAGAVVPAETPRRSVLTETGEVGRHLLGGQWLFREDPLDAGLSAAWGRSAAAAGWSAVTVPHVFNAGVFTEASMLGSVGWYRKDFRVPRGQGTAWAVRFEGAGHRLRAWLNGREIGAHEGSYLPFELRANGLRPDRVNRLVVRIDSRTTQTDLPPGGLDDKGDADGGWWNYGGISREVYLRRVSALDVEDVWVRSELECATCAATLITEARVRNTTPRMQAVSGSMTVTPPRSGSVPATGPGAQIARVRARRAQRSALSLDGPARLKPGAAATYRARTQLGAPVLWDLGRGALYRVRVDVDGGGAFVRRHGIRRVELAPGGKLTVNGRSVSLRGASLHEDDLRVGSALSPARRRADVAALADLGATVTRAHYPVHPHTLELLDRAGILLWAQTPVYQLREPQLADPAVRERAVSLVRELVRRDRSHPSVLTWSLANELPSRPGPGHAATLEAMATAAREADPDRFVSVDILGHPGVEAQSAYRVVDALGINAYFGWYPGPGGATGDRRNLGAFLDDVRAKYPDHALFVTEFGAEANRDGPADEKGTYAFQSRLLRDTLATVSERPFLNGAITWLLRDFRVKPGWAGGNPKPTAPINAKGLIDDTGRRKPAFDELRRLFRP